MGRDESFPAQSIHIKLVSSVLVDYDRNRLIFLVNLLSLDLKLPML